MIHFVVLRLGRRGLDHLLRKDAGVDVCSSILFYENLHRLTALEAGVVVFTDLDLLGPERRAIVSRLATRLDETPGLRVLNHPDRVRLREDLLRRLHEEGINGFQASAATDTIDADRFPVFLRERDRHTGALTGLLADRSELDRALEAKRILGYRRSDLLVVDFCNTRDEQGVFRKYSAFCVEGHVMPRYLNSSHHWDVKMGHTSEAGIAAESAYVDCDPHAEWIRDVFRIAGIDYGRIDYGVQEDIPQAWEINLNPSFGRRWWQWGSSFIPDDWRQKRERAKEIFFRGLFTDLERLAGKHHEPVVLPQVVGLKGLRRSVDTGCRDLFHRVLASKVPPFKQIGRVLNLTAESVAEIIGRSWK